jgi:hypothetical protein
MFRLIGIIVVLAIIFFGWDGISGWYRGEATPESAVNDIRRGIGSAITPSATSEAKGVVANKTSPGGDVKGTAPAPAPVPPPATVVDPAADLIKKALD